MGDAQTALPAALNIEEESLLAELAILEYLLHQSIVLRLNNLYPTDPLQPAQERADRLQRAHYFSQIIQSTRGQIASPFTLRPRLHFIFLEMLDSLKVSFGADNVPFDDALRRRLDWAQLIGLTFFYGKAGDSWEALGQQDDPRQVVGRVYTLFLELFDLSTPSAPQMLVELATQMHICTRQADPPVPVVLPANVAGEFQRRLEQRIALIEEGVLTNEPAEAKFPFAQFGRNFCGFLRSIYRDIEAPIISRFCESAATAAADSVAPIAKPAMDADWSLETDARRPEAPSDSASPMDVVSQFDFMTQPATQALWAASPSDSDGSPHGPAASVKKFPSSSALPTQATVVSGGEPHSSSAPGPRQKTAAGKAPGFVTGPPVPSIAILPAPVAAEGGSQVGDSGPAQAALPPRPRERQSSHSSQANRLPGASATGDGLPAAAESVLSKDAPGDSHVSGPLKAPQPPKTSEASENAPPSNASGRVLSTLTSASSCLPERILRLATAMPIIPPEAFRAHLSQNDDELAMIAEGKHPAVVAHLEHRQKRKSRPLSTGDAVETKRPLLERHASAEKIAWSSSLPASPNRSPAETKAVASRPSTALSSKPAASHGGAGRRYWSDMETSCLKEGYRRFGNNWQLIWSTYPEAFEARTNVDLKDKARNLIKKGLL